jgi:lipoprotein
MNYNQFRPERRAVQSNQADHAEHGERGQHWQKPQFANQQPATE